MNKNNDNSLTHIGNILETALKTFRPKSDIQMIKIWDNWTQSVGAEVAKNAEPALFKNGTLIVNVSSSVWIHHLKFLEKDIITNINLVLDKKLVNKIRFKIAKIHN